jgi:hypothetical protein
MAQLINGPKRYKQFVKSALADVQDPVFLTFDLDFFPNQADEKSAWIPTVTSTTGDDLYWDNLLRPARDKESLATNSKYVNVEWSAQDWLLEYGSAWTKRTSGFLTAAIAQLRKLQESPWYFQSIQGVDQLWKAASRVKEGDKKVEITINCLDSIEQPLLKFAGYYRKAIYDADKLCYTLPDNLRTFDMTITLFEIRDIDDRSANLASGLHQIKYRLQRCEFDFSETLGGPTSGSEIKAYTEDKPFSTSFKIRAGWVIEESESSTDSDYHSLGIFAGLASSLEGRAQRFLSSAARLPARIIGDLTNQLQTRLETSLSQNVYNRSTEVLGTNEVFGRRAPVGPTGGQGVNDDVYPGADINKIIRDGELGDVYP